MNELQITRVDYSDPQQGKDLVTLLNAYALDPLGGNTPLRDEVKQTLPAKLAELAGANSFIAYVNDQPVGLLNAFMGFSTFNASPLINIHDVYVAPDVRGKGVVDALFAAIEAVAKELNCCKITLEVLEENGVAQSAYKRLGYKGYDLGELGGEALFWQKKLS
jgi:ribosomal protein S18 acetylase RimI-like enzyme